MTRKDKKVRVAFVGLGKFSYELAKAAVECENLEITSCFSRTPEKRSKFAESFKCREETSFSAICNAGDIDGAILVTPNEIHCEQTIALAAAGKHVFVEKPICNTIEEADLMVEKCSTAGVVLAVGHQLRRCGVYRKWKNMLKNGELGDPLLFEANHCGNLLKIWPHDDWRFHDGANAGPLLHKGIHKLDLLTYFFGEAQSVVSMACTLPFNSNVNETTVSAFKFNNGLIGTLNSSFRFNHNRISIIGSEQSVSYSGYGNTFELKNESTWEFTEVECPAVNAIKEELFEFGEAVLGRCEYEVDGKTAREALKLASGARTAVATEKIYEFKSSSSNRVSSGAKGA